MATVALLAQDRQFIAAAASGFTTYGTYTAARDAAITASAGASSAPYVTANVIEEFFGPTATLSGEGGTGPDSWIIQAASVATYLPKATAEATAAAAATASAPYLVARLFQTVTGP
jgi:hypothetical protein